MFWPLFIKYYQNLFVPFIQSLFQKTLGIYWVLIFTSITAISYWNVYSAEGPSMPVYIILISGLVMYCTYAFSFFMFSCKRDGLFDISQQHTSALVFNLFSAIFPVLFFVSYFTGFFMIHHVRTGTWLLSNNSWFILTSLIMGLTISNYQFTRWSVETNQTTDEISINKMLLIALIFTGLAIGVYFAIYYFVPENYFVLTFLVLFLASLVLYSNSIKRANQFLERTISK